MPPPGATRSARRSTRRSAPARGTRHAPRRIMSARVRRWYPRPVCPGRSAAARAARSPADATGGDGRRPAPTRDADQRRSASCSSRTIGCWPTSLSALLGARAGHRGRRHRRHRRRGEGDVARAPRRRPHGLPPARRHRRRGDARDQGPLAGGPGRHGHGPDRRRDRPRVDPGRRRRLPHEGPRGRGRRRRPSAPPTPARRCSRAR